MGLLHYVRSDVAPSVIAKGIHDALLSKESVNALKQSRFQNVRLLRPPFGRPRNDVYRSNFLAYEYSAYYGKQKNVIFAFYIKHKIGTFAYHDKQRWRFYLRNFNKD